MYRILKTYNTHIYFSAYIHVHINMYELIYNTHKYNYRNAHINNINQYICVYMWNRIEMCTTHIFHPSPTAWHLPTAAQLSVSCTWPACRLPISEVNPQKKTGEAGLVPPPGQARCHPEAACTVVCCAAPQRASRAHAYTWHTFLHSFITRYHVLQAGPALP